MRELSSPATYFPISHGRYEVTPNLYQFGADFGNGDTDRKMFQIDRDHFLFRENLLAARTERLPKYYCIDRYAEAENAIVANFIARRLSREYPDLFSRDTGDKETILHCRLTGEHLHFDHRYKLKNVTFDHEPVTPEYVSALDALAGQVPEDLAVISARSASDHWISAIHLCAPNYWAAEDKIGKNFAAAHAPVVGMEPTIRAQTRMVDAMIHKGPFVRFTWGLVTDRRLNHHPQPPPGADPAMWMGRCFDSDRPALYLRIERQVTWGFPEIGAVLFTVKTCFTDCVSLRRDPVRKSALIRAIESMNEKQLHYKGLARNRQPILQWLNGDNQALPVSTAG